MPFDRSKCHEQPRIQQNQKNIITLILVLVSECPWPLHFCFFSFFMWLLFLAFAYDCQPNSPCPIRLFSFFYYLLLSHDSFAFAGLVSLILINYPVGRHIPASSPRNPF